MVDDAVKKFQELLVDMRRGLPMWKYYGLIENLIPDKEIRDYMIKKEVFVKGQGKNAQGQDIYFLGVNGMILANNFEMERLARNTMKLTSQIKWLTWTIIGLTVLSILLLISSNPFPLFLPF